MFRSDVWGENWVFLKPAVGKCSEKSFFLTVSGKCKCRREFLENLKFSENPEEC